MMDVQARNDTGYDEADEARRPRPKRATIGALLALLLLVNLSTSLYQLPLNRVIERRLCHDYYNENDPSSVLPGGSIPEHLCKIDRVQQGLAWIQGAMDTAWIAGDFVMTIPLGFVAEKYGQRTVLWLNLIPRVFMLAWAVVVGYFEHIFPPRAIIAGPFLSLLGGDCVFNSMTYALAASITDDYVLRYVLGFLTDQRLAKLNIDTSATYFGWMSSISYVVALLGPALASASMSVLLWLPFFIGITLLLLAVPTISLLPDHPDAIHNDRAADEQSRPLISSPLLKAQDADSSVLSAISKRYETLRAMVASHTMNLLLLFISFFLTSLASSDTKLLPQYISKRYGWTFASAGYLLSGKAIVNFVLLTVIIPSLLRSRHSLSSGQSLVAQTDRANIGYALTCLAVSVLGAFSIGIAPGIWLLIPALLVYALGSALPVFTLSLLKSPAIQPERDGRLSDKDTETHMFALVMMIKTLGSLVGAPLMAILWVRGISLGGMALGVPYFTSSACYVVAILVISRIRT